MVEAVEGARVEASLRCSSTQTQQFLAEDSSRTVRRMMMVDGAVCDLCHTQNRGGDGAGCSKCRAQIRGGDDVFLQEHRRRCPRENGSRRGGGSSACLTKTGGEWRHRLKRRQHRYGGLITDVVAAAWKGAATPPSFGGVDDEAATNGRATQTR